MGCQKLDIRRKERNALRVACRSKLVGRKVCVNSYPFGLNIQNSDYADGADPKNSYQYNGKELNTDLGLNWMDYGARWYDPSVGRFTSVDRFAEKYSFQTPYAYAANDPIKFIDVNGDSIRINGGNGEAVFYTPGANYEGSDKFIGQVFEALNHIESNNADVCDVICETANSDQTVDIVKNTRKNNPLRSQGNSKSYYNTNSAANPTENDNTFIVWDPGMGMGFRDNGEKGGRSPAEVLLHELGHTQSYFSDPDQHMIDSRTKAGRYGNVEERDIIRSIENAAAIILRGNNAVERSHHKGVFLGSSICY